MKRRHMPSILLVFLFLASAVRAEITEIVVTVDGVACPFCVYGIEKKLNEVDGVEGVEISLKAGTATLRTDEGKVPTIEALRTAVTKAGFTPGEITFTAIGMVHARDDRVLLRLRGAGTEYLLVSDSQEPAQPLDERTRTRLHDLARTESLVAVTGAVHAHADLELALSTGLVEEVHTVVLAVEGMRCENCVERLTTLFADSQGVYRASVSLDQQRATIESIGQRLDPAALIALAEDAGFQASVAERGS